MSLATPQRRSRRQSAGLSQPEIIFVVVLGAIILFSLVMVFIMATGGGGGGGAAAELRYKCEKCDHEFEQKAAKLPDLGPDAEYPPPLDCPACGEKGLAFPAVQCPKCGRYFLLPSQAVERAVKDGRTDVDPASVRDVCPHCDTDRAKWYAEHRGQKR